MKLLRITLKSDLCAGSGEATGVSVDRDLCIDQYGLPYIPARRLKGCLRESAELLWDFGCPEAEERKIKQLFGTPETPGCLTLRDAQLPGAAEMRAWLSGKDKLPEVLSLEARPLNVAKLFTYVRGQTKLKDGIAEDNTLRYTRVLDRFSALAPGQETVLEAELMPPEDETLYTLLEKCCKATRHIGTMRNRGLGNVYMELVDTACGEKRTWRYDESVQGAEIELRYTLSLDAPVTLPGCGEQSAEIPARSVIGCVASAFLSQGGDANAPDFTALFLDGSKTKWSALTPVVKGTRSLPAPLMLVELKNEKLYQNLFAPTTEVQGKKQKNLSGKYAAPTADGFQIPEVRSHTLYHHGHGEDGSLYLQESLDAGMLYGGVVTVPAELAPKLFELLKQTSFAFGRSKSAQYAACSLCHLENRAVKEEERTVPKGETVYVVLESDLVLEQDGLYRVDPDAVRRAISVALDLEDTREGLPRDYCQYHTISGYQQQWKLQKPQIPAVRGGSVYCFRAKGGDVKTALILGAFQQEGFGRCRVYSEAEMKRLGTVTECAVDELPPSQETSAWRDKLEDALILSAARRALREKMWAYYQKTRANGVRPGTLGRLRLMLTEAKDYADFLRRVDSIETSDASAEREKSDHDRALELVRDLFSRLRSTKEQSIEQENELDVLKPLCDDPEPPESNREEHRLADLIRKHPQLTEALEKEWKAPLRFLLHIAYYDKDNKDKKGG